MQEMTPQERVALASEHYTNILVNATQYTGSTKAGEKVFSASSLGGEPLQNYLTWKYGKDDKAKYTASTIGTIYQLGCDRAVEIANAEAEAVGIIQPRYESALRVRRTLPNGWEVSGEMDHLDHDMKVIIDNKVISKTAYAEIMKNSPDHDYNLQQAVYQWLIEPTHGRYEAVLAIINKGGAAIRNDIYTMFHLNTYESDIIEAALIAETNALQYYIDNDAVPPQCDIFKYGKTKDIPNRCALYCNHNHHCPYYSPFKKEKDLISALSMV